MTIILSQADYRELVWESEQCEQNTLANGDDIICQYPAKLGEGYSRFIELREGLELAIANYQLYEDVISEDSDREHPLECTFHLSGMEAGYYGFYGSGMAPGERWYCSAAQRISWISIHVQPELFCQWFNISGLPPALQSLIRRSDQKYYECHGRITSTMRMALQQLLHCPYQGVTQRAYFESKVWELIALQIAQVVPTPTCDRSAYLLKSDDVDRIHHARDILLQRFNDPPSLVELARQVGLNDFKLKLGFRQIFNTTVFGYLQEYRLEQARLLLANKQMSVKQIAHTVGYAHPGYFAIAFKRKFGISPKAYQSDNDSSFL